MLRGELRRNLDFSPFYVMGATEETRMKTLILTVTALSMIATVPAAAADLTPRERLDLLEDRIDRRENRIDRQTDNGWRDRLEDVVDRREDVRDRRGLDGPSRIDRHERRSWRRIWGRQG